MPSKIISIALLVIVGILIYSNTLNGPFNFDDYFSIVANRNIKDASDLRKIWDFWPTRFLTYYSLALNYHYGALGVSSYHWFNLSAHLISGILVWWLSLMTLSVGGAGIFLNKRAIKILAFFCGMLFIAHPVQTEAVSYIIQRSVSLATLFYLLSLGLYVKAGILKRENKSSSLRLLFYAGALIASVMAMFTKEMAATLPLALLLYEFCFFKNTGRISWKPVAPFLLTLFIIPAVMLFTGSVNFSGMHRAIEPAAGIFPSRYLFTQFRVLTTYLRLAFFPINQNLDYDYAVSNSILEFNTLIGLLILVIVIFSAIKAFRRHRLISFSVFWFFLTLLPESSIIPIKDVIFEHRLYPAMFGYCLFVAVAIFCFCSRRNIKTALVILIILCAGYAGAAYKRNFVWQDELLLWNDVILKSPAKARPYNERGFVYLVKGNYKKAISDFAKALQIDPKYASAYNNRGAAFIRTKDYEQAALDFSRAIAIEEKYASAYANRAIANFYRREYDKALQDTKKAKALGLAVDSRFLQDLEAAVGSSPR